MGIKWLLLYFVILFCLIFFLFCFTLYAVLYTVGTEARASSGEKLTDSPPAEFHSLTPTIVTRSGESAGRLCRVEWFLLPVYKYSTLEYIHNDHARIQNIQQYCVDIRISRQINAYSGTLMQEPSHTLSPESIQSIHPSIHPYKDGIQCPVCTARWAMQRSSFPRVPQPMEYYYAVQSTHYYYHPQSLWD